MPMNPNFTFSEEQTEEDLQQRYEEYLEGLHEVPGDDGVILPEPRKRKKTSTRGGMFPVFHFPNVYARLPAYQHLRNFFRRVPFKDQD